MRFSSLSVAGYRAFLLPAELELRPLTLIFGQNNSGKSRLLRLLPALREALVSRATHPLLPTKGDAPETAVKDLYSAAQAEQVMGLRLTWTYYGQPFNAHYRFRYLADRQLTVVENLDLDDIDPEPTNLQWDVGDLVHTSTGVKARYVETNAEGAATESALVCFQGAMPTETAGLSVKALDRLNRLQQGLHELSDRIFWLGPLRTVPQRIQRLTDRPARPSSDGSNVGNLLAPTDEASGRLLEFVSSWFLSATDQQLKVVRGVHGSDSLFSLALSPRSAPIIEIPVCDAGDGIGQVLPVITCLGLLQLQQLTDQSVFAFEHPELHLHNSVHPHLARMFCEVAAARAQSSLIVETHSESFVLAVQTAIAAGRIDPSKVIVHWVTQIDGGYSSVTKVEFDRLGEPIGGGWPPRAFGDVSQQALELLSIRRSRQQ